ncbi:MAG: HIT family protein [Candidatus Nanoarchaeia archaeon]
MTSDIYCDEILSGKTPIKKFYESKNFLVYYHTLPFWEFHLVLIPKFHIVNLYEIKNEQLKIEYFDTLSNVVKLVEEEKNKCQVMFNVEEYQHSKHLHLHIHSGKRIRE